MTELVGISRDGASYSLSLPAQLIAPETSADYSPCILPNMPQTGVFTAQIATVAPISNLSRELRFKEPQYASQHKRPTDDSEITLHHLFFDFTH